MAASSEQISVSSGTGAPGVEVGEITTHGLALSRPRRGFESRWGHHSRDAAGRDFGAQLPANTFFLIVAWTPQLPSTTWVMPKSTATDMREIASFSLRPLVVMRKWRIFRNASLIARSTEDFS